MTTILLADADMHLRGMLRSILEVAGYAVITVAEGNAALAYLRAHSERVIALLDGLLADGTQSILTIIAAEPHLAQRHVYIVMLPALQSSSISVPHDMLVLHKPLDVDTLHRMLSRATTTLQTLA